MIKQFALRLFGVSLLGICWAGTAPLVMAESSTQETPGGTTTYFPTDQKPSAAPSAPASPTPATTAAIPTSSDPPKDTNAAPAAVSPKSQTPASTAAVSPPASPASDSKAATGDSKAAPAAGPAPVTPEATPPAAQTDTAIVTPPPTGDSSAPAASPAPSAPTPPPATSPAAAPSTPPAAPAGDTAQQPKPAEPTPTVAAPPPPPPVNPAVLAARSKLSDKSFASGSANDDVAAARDYYDSHEEPLWVKGGEFTHKAKEIIATLKGADDWGLDSSAFAIPALGNGSASEGAAEAQLTLSALKYARFARGGRLDPVSLSNILDMKPPVKEPKATMRELASASDPGAFLRGLNPKHVGFERLRQALLKARGGQAAEEPAEPVDPALLVKLPNGKSLKRGVKDNQVSLLRQRLKVPADNPDDENLYDDQLADAVRAFQQDNGLKANGVVTNRVRSALNSQGQPKAKRRDPSGDTDRLIANMERWRWLPTDLGKFYVMNNIPEYTSEIWKDDRLDLKQKIIVGQPSWPTPLLAAKMQFVIFKPSWGMPDGIKAKELMPRLRQASGNSGFGFFDQLFGGGPGYTGADVIQAYKLQVYYNGQRIDPTTVNWRTADIRQYSFIQPPGGDNPLGLVKFRFPNRHDVYMHDTPERNLFGQSSRALSHGCMRVEDPRRTAEVILQEDKGYSPEKVGELWDSGASVTLSKEIPVYLVYFTARVGDDGQLDTYSDIYGIDDRVMSALRGRPVRFVAQEAIDPTEASEPGASGSSGYGDSAVDAGSDNLQDSPRKNRKNAKKNGPGSGSTGNPIQDALQNIFLN
ncbi:MAG: L,D-transpeptidase family protein [Hyphomicrobium sp.]|uniref:L,D-transpeptidase family protein n=1 Tax=Hyphomicrobium sp. TaxID=82 RepID=UPI0039E706B8